MSLIDTDAGLELIQVLQNMGELHTNPVLNLLGENPNLIENHKYPTGYLCFGGDTWRAYYHCHAAPNKLMNEHGHFHIFARLEDEIHNSQAWSHIVALAIDSMGQPLSWFTVNHWVTGKTWKNANELNILLKNLPIVHDESLVEQWLIAMLRFYRANIHKLLENRDTQINALKRSTGKEILEDCNYYELSTRPINLLKELK